MPTLSDLTAGHTVLSDLTNAQILDLGAYLGDDGSMQHWPKLAKFSWEAGLDRARYIHGVELARAAQATHSPVPLCAGPTDPNDYYKEPDMPSHPTQTRQTIRTIKRLAKAMESLIHAAKENPQVSQDQLERAVRHIGKTITEAVPPLPRQSAAAITDLQPAVTVVNDSPTPDSRFYVTSLSDTGTLNFRRHRPRRVEITAVYQGSIHGLCKQMGTDDVAEVISRLAHCMEVKWADKEFNDKLTGLVGNRSAE